MKLVFSLLHGATFLSRWWEYFFGCLPTPFQGPLMSLLLHSRYDIHFRLFYLKEAHPVYLCPCLSSSFLHLYSISGKRQFSSISPVSH